jgi:hypothetical protein
MQSTPTRLPTWPPSREQLTPAELAKLRAELAAMTTYELETYYQAGNKACSFNAQTMVPPSLCSFEEGAACAQHVRMFAVSSLLAAVKRWCPGIRAESICGLPAYDETFDVSV